MKFFFAMLLAAIFFAACSNNNTAPPEPTATPEFVVEKKIEAPQGAEEEAYVVGLFQPDQQGWARVEVTSWEGSPYTSAEVYFFDDDLRKQVVHTGKFFGNLTVPIDSSRVGKQFWIQFMDPKPFS